MPRVQATRGRSLRRHPGHPGGPGAVGGDDGAPSRRRPCRRGRRGRCCRRWRRCCGRRWRLPGALTRRRGRGRPGVGRLRAPSRRRLGWPARRPLRRLATRRPARLPVLDRPRARSSALDLLLQLDQRDDPAPIGAAEEDALAEDVDRDHFFLALCGLQHLAFAREALAGRDVELMLVPQTAEQAATAAGDLRRVEREVLILREGEADGRELAQPGAAAILPAAAAHSLEARRFIPDADLPEIDAGAEDVGEVAHQSAEIDSLLRREKDGELGAIPLPLGVAHLHVELVVAHLLDHLAAGILLRAAQVVGLADLILGGATDNRPAS